MTQQIIDTKLVFDIITNIVTTTAQFGQPSPTVVGPFAAGDLIYSYSIKNYITNNFGSNEGVTDEFSRDILMKTVLTGFIIWITQIFTDSGVGLLDGTLNALISYTASNGFQNILDNLK